MELIKITCENCGGNLQVKTLSHIKNQKVKCQYCGAAYIISAKHSDIGAKFEVEMERLRDSERKQATKAEWEFKNNQEERKYILRIGKYFVLFLVIGLIALGILGFLETHPLGTIIITTSENSLKDENYKIAIKKLEDMGFKNIKTEKVKDLKLGILKSEGDVKEVTINGENNFKKDDQFDKNAKVKIYYHVFDK